MSSGQDTEEAFIEHIHDLSLSSDEEAACVGRLMKLIALPVVQFAADEAHRGTPPKVLLSVLLTAVSRVMFAASLSVLPNDKDVHVRVLRTHGRVFKKLLRAAIREVRSGTFSRGDTATDG